ncbi:translocation/assembly module TamB domain-containing protein [Bacteroides sp. 519]|uniref:translocation/assembly module TamB domain-containing protein n=1 Tax=Bacteroides sp. 519 TaxID=2302937 RepID=UPI0013D0B891|nr:translocation/assembly module TamB domain-containing protein [Bacteroides sp. 519]NDV59955.1 translocation/assembly module TamB [Bacteroides sp. 519]
MLDTKVEISRINAGLLNRIIIDDLLVEDQSGKEMLKVSRLSAKYEILPLLQKKISISSVQLFGFNIQLNKASSEADLNFKFILDAFASNDSIKKAPNIDLRINSLIIRRGSLAYDVNSIKETPGKFNPQHIKLYNILGNISLKAFRNDTINAQIKRFSVDEQSGLELRKLSMKVLGSETNMTIENFEVGLPGTLLKMDTLRMDYDSLGSFNHFVTDVNFSFRMLPSYVTLQDIAPFVPVFNNFKEKLHLELDAHGTVNQLKCPRLFVRSGNQLRISGKVDFQDLSDPENAFIYGKLSNLSANREGIDFLVRNFSKHYSETPPIFSRLGNTAFNGEITGYFTDLVTYGTLNTDLGSVKGDVKFTSDKQNNLFSYSGTIVSEKFELGKWLNNEKWGEISYKMDIKSNSSHNAYPNLALKGDIQSVEYSGYEYNNIVLDGEYKNGGFDGAFKLDDENGFVFINGHINMNEKIPVFNFYANIDHFRPHNLKITPNYQDSEIALKINANFTGGNIDEMIGSINVDSVSYTSPNNSYFIDNINVSANNYNNKNILTLHSEILDVKVEGKYSYLTLPNSIMTLVSQYLPSVFPPKKNTVKNKNDFNFDIDIYNVDVLREIFNIPITIYSNAEIKGYYNDYANRFKIDVNVPQIEYGNYLLESGLISCDNALNVLNGEIRVTSHRKNGSVSIALDTEIKDDKLTASINWGNNSAVTYSGHLEATAKFNRLNENAPSFNTQIDIKPTEIILNDTIWNVHQSKISLEDKKIHVDNFLFSKEGQFLLIDGYASDDMNSLLNVKLQDINISYVFDIFNLRSIDFQGMASGTATAHSLLKNPVMNTSLSVRRFCFNDTYLGEMDITGRWDGDEMGIYLDAVINEKDIAENKVSGYIFPLKPKSGIDLDIHAKNINLAFMREYLNGITPDINGRGSGNVRLYGGFSSLNIVGKAKANATFKVDVLDTYFTLNDSIQMLKEEISFNNASFSDLEGHKGSVNGYLRHKNFKNMNYRFQVNANNMLVMNTHETPDMPFYGKIYGTGNATLRGNMDALTVDAGITTNRNTTFVYTLAESASAVSNQFIKFVDKTPGRNIDYEKQLSGFELAQQKKKKSEEKKGEMDIKLNIVVDANPEANVRIIMDPISGDYISGKGSGNLRAEYYNKGDIRMFGNYYISQGVYKFSLQEVIRKDFIINQGSNIIFNGNPGDATMDIQAIYTVNSASLSDLIPERGTGELIKRNNVRVNCLMNLTGVLYRPTIKLGIELPNEREEIQELVHNYVSTDEEVNMQILYLLGIGKFYTPSNIASTQNSNVMTSVLSSTLSGQLNNVLSQFLENKNWNFGTNLSTGERGWTDIELEGVLSAQLLNNRLLINGNFGYRENPLSETNFVGDFDAQWLLIPSGDLRLKAYNQTNDRYFTRSNLTTQGIGILFKKDFDRWGDLFLNWRNKQKKKAEESKESEQASETESMDNSDQ